MNQFTDLDLKIFAGVLRKQVTKWDETWGNAQWRRENKMKPEGAFWEEQREARDRAEVLADMFWEEQKRRSSTRK